MPAAPDRPLSSPPKNRAGDAWGGFAAMLVALPSSIAYGVAAYAPLGAAYVGHGVRAGVLGAIALGLIASALGGAPRLISAPCAPAGAVVASLVGALAVNSSGEGVALSIVLFIREQTRSSVVRRRITGDRISSTQHRLPEEQAVLEREGALTMVCELQGSLFFGTTDQLLTELEPGLKACRYLILDLLRDLKADQSLAALAGGVVERSFAAGRCVFKAGDPGDELYLIRRGIVRVALPLKGGSHHNLASFARGNHFGEVAFLNPGARSADATATTDTDLFVISRARFDEVSRTNPVVGVKMFARLASALALRLRHTDAELRTLYES